MLTLTENLEKFNFITFNDLSKNTTERKKKHFLREGICSIYNWQIIWVWRIQRIALKGKPIKKNGYSHELASSTMKYFSQLIDWQNQKVTAKFSKNVEQRTASSPGIPRDTIGSVWAEG